MLLETPQVQVGWQAEDFELPDADGKRYRLDDFLGGKGLLIAFICNHCPYVKAVAGRLVEDAKALQAEGVAVVAINSNDYRTYTEDSPPMMKRFAEQHGFSFPYLVDEQQSVARAYDAVCTPDFFAFDGAGELKYRGRLDDARMDNTVSNRSRELVDAMRLIVATGSGPDVQHPSMGCSIKWRT